MADSIPDQLTAYLDGVRGDIGALEALVTRLTTFAVPVAEFNAAQDRLAGHTPRLLAAVEKVLKLADELVATEFPDDEEMTTSQGAIVAAGIEARIHDGHFIRDSISAALLGEEKSS